MSDKKPRKRDRSKEKARRRDPAQPAPAAPVAELEASLASAEAQIKLLTSRNERLENELRERRDEDAIARACAHAFELIQTLASHRHRFESIELRVAPEKIVHRAVPYESTLVVTYPAGTQRFTAVAGDPARALLEALAQFKDQMKLRKVPAVEDLSSLFALLDNQHWQVVKSGYLPNLAKALDRELDHDLSKIAKKA